MMTVYVSLKTFLAPRRSNWQESLTEKNHTFKATMEYYNSLIATLLHSSFLRIIYLTEKNIQYAYNLYGTDL